MTQLLICIFVLAMMVMMTRSKTQIYQCMQCGSKNGEHADHCTWKK